LSGKSNGDVVLTRTAHSMEKVRPAHSRQYFDAGKGITRREILLPERFRFSAQFLDRLAEGQGDNRPAGMIDVVSLRVDAEVAIDRRQHVLR